MAVFNLHNSIKDAEQPTLVQPDRGSRFFRLLKIIRVVKSIKVVRIVNFMSTVMRYRHMTATDDITH